MTTPAPTTTKSSFPRKLTVTSHAIHANLPRAERDSATLTLEWDATTNTLAIAAQTLPKKRDAGTLLGDINRVTRQASHVSSIMGFVHRLQTSVCHLEKLTPVRLPILEGQWCSSLSSNGHEFDTLLREHIPQALLRAVYGNSHRDPVFVWAADGFDPERFGSPYLIPSMKFQDPAWTLAYIGESAYGTVFDTEGDRTVRWQDTEGLMRLTSLVLGHDFDYAETLALLGNSEKFGTAVADHSRRQRNLLIISDYSRPKDRVKPRVISDLVLDAGSEVAIRWSGSVYQDLPKSSMRSFPVAFSAREMPTSVPQGLKSATIHAAVGIALRTLGKDGRWGNGLAATAAAGYDEITKDFALTLQKLLDQRKLGTVVIVKDAQECDQMFVVRNVDLFHRHCEAFGIPKGNEARGI